ncbi:hypothetical protein HEP74_03752 [Xanthomonas sp. SS]|uniref:hypothetical protein n=1 Tax=Xanthomonas sp. SS TaxID=2724122 RepID=UPI0016398505|nr:hypothetical protein [Xanthomonas sp. SS]QNH18580.1 hypothetical protein HEP74_03752 [Xanthomonas sp. SS]
MLDALLSRLGPKSEREERLRLRDFQDRARGTCHVGDLPEPLHMEAAEWIHFRCGGRRFDADFLDGLELGDEQRKCFEAILVTFLRVAERIVGAKAPRKGDAAWPWRLSVFIAPTLEVNACVKSSFDSKQHTIFIVINAGLLLQLTHRISAVLQTPSFTRTFGIEPAISKASTAPPSKHGPWLVPLHGNPLVLMATLYAAVMVLTHELAHFYRGHLHLTRNVFGDDALLEESDTRGEVRSERLPPNERRLLELDADETAGRLASVLWRQLDYPQFGPDDSSNENFFLGMLLGTTCLFLLLDETVASERYYSPFWRLRITVASFNRDYFAAPDDADAEHAADSIEVFKLMQTVIEACQAAHRELGWSEGLDSRRFLAEAEVLLADDRQALQDLLLNRLAPLMPYAFRGENTIDAT